MADISTPVIAEEYKQRVADLYLDTLKYWIDGDASTTNGSFPAWQRWLYDHGTASSVSWQRWQTSSSSVQEYETGWHTWVEEPVSLEMSDGRTWREWNVGRVENFYIPELAQESSVRGRIEIQPSAAAPPLPRTKSPAQLAREKGLQLLKLFLMPQQVKQLTEGNGFVVRAASGKRYRINRGGRVDELDGDRAVAAYCIHHRYGLRMPHEDTMLSQKLLLEADEEEFLRIANRTELRH